MVAIELEEFEGYDLGEFKEYLITQQTDEFEISFQKEGVLFFSPHNDLAWEFATAAYIGQRLSGISTEFKYSRASIADPDNFSFQIKTQKIEELAHILHLLSGGFGNSDLSEPIDLSSEVDHFIEAHKNVEIACKDLLETYFEYYKEEDDEND